MYKDSYLLPTMLIITIPTILIGIYFAPKWCRCGDDKCDECVGCAIYGNCQC